LKNNNQINNLEANIINYNLKIEIEFFQFMSVQKVFSFYSAFN